MKTSKEKTKSYIIIISTILLVAILGSVFVNLGTEWFSSLKRPSQFVPDFIIPIVWTIIYALFAIVLCVWASKENLTTKTKVLLIINAVLNVLWCLIFFTFNQTLGGLIFIVLLLISAYILIIDINKQKQIYSFILALYPVWVSIATCLNLALWILN